MKQFKLIDKQEGYEDNKTHRGLSELLFKQHNYRFIAYVYEDKKTGEIFIRRLFVPDDKKIIKGKKR